MMFSKAVLTFLIIAVLSISVSAAPLRVRAEGGGNDKQQKVTAEKQKPVTSTETIVAGILAKMFPQGRRMDEAGLHNPEGLLLQLRKDRKEKKQPPPSQGQ